MARDWDKIPGNNTFLKAIKKDGITYKKLKGVLFGSVAIKVIKAVRKHVDDKKCFPILKKSHQMWYMCKVAFRELEKPQS